MEEKKKRKPKAAAEGEGREHKKNWQEWLVAMVAGWVDDEAVNHVILTFVGEQGIYKTTWFCQLLPPGLPQGRGERLPGLLRSAPHGGGAPHEGALAGHRQARHTDDR